MPLKQYLKEVQADHQTGGGVKEETYYPQLRELFNAVGKSLSPKVRCVIQLGNRGMGKPDGGFFTPSEFKAAGKQSEEAKGNPLSVLSPQRGVLEAKAPTDTLQSLRESEQFGKYLFGNDKSEGYGQLLITNLREFELWRTVDGTTDQKILVDEFCLAPTAEAFWKLDPENCAKERGEQFEEFIKRCLMSGAPIASPQDVAAFLASYAREARLRLEPVDMSALQSLKTALENALGIRFVAVDNKLSAAEQAKRGERFFRATLVQTLFYGLFSAWITHVESGDKTPFNWQSAQWSFHVPAVSIIFQQLMQPAQLEPLGIRSLVELAAGTLNRVQTTKFFEKWNEALAVQYFYEPFLEQYDPVLRKELGVYYTPPEIVRYMVERVHHTLEHEMGYAGGLAHPDVIVLDPCCGTGAYILEVLRKIGTVLQKQNASTVGEQLKKAALERVFGFEILPAPFVVAHHNVAAILAEVSAGQTKFVGEERAKIFLTNALTGWTGDDNLPIEFDELRKERDSAQQVKQGAEILVIIGNPPYDAFAKDIQDADLTRPYKAGLQNQWKVKKFNLDELYVRFFRVAERYLVRGSKNEGILCYISNFSYLNKKSFVVMRQHLLEGFDAMWIDVLNGDSRETGKRIPQGKGLPDEGGPDPSVFSTPFNKPGIRVGTAINLMLRSPKLAGHAL